MNKDRVIGAARQLAGSAKETLGQLVGDAKLQFDGKIEQIEGKAQDIAGSAEDTLKGA